MEYLDFELPIKELEDQLDKCEIIGQESDVDVTNTCKQIEKKLQETKSPFSLSNICAVLDESFNSKETLGLRVQLNSIKKLLKLIRLLIIWQQIVYMKRLVINRIEL